MKDTIIQPFLKIRPANDQNIHDVVNAAHEDGHNPIAATDLIIKDGRVVGYVGIGSVPVVTWWMDTKRTQIRDTFTVLSHVEGTLASRGVQFYFMPCEDKSPYSPLLEKAGFEQIKYNQLFLRKL